MTTQIEAMKMALEALGSCENMLPEYHQWLSDAQYELRAAIEAAEKVGPVAEKVAKRLASSNAKVQATDAALSRQVACTDGLGLIGSERTTA